MPQFCPKIKRAALVASLIFTANCWAVSEVPIFRALEERGRVAEEVGNRDLALGFYVAGMAINPAFYDTRFVDDVALQQRVDERREPPAGQLLQKWTPPGGRVYVYAEEGMGDTIQFCRYLPQLVARGYEVIFRSQKPLATLMAHSFGSSIWIDVETPEAELYYDYYIPLLSLPEYCFAGVDGIPGKEGYLAADRVERHEGVGLVWQGFPGRKNDVNRSVPLEKLMRLGELASLYSLQVGFGSEQIGEGIVDLGATFGDFADTAAVLKGLDLLISVDTSVAHLGGALGVETWILIPYEPDWRWFRDGDTSPFYGTVRLFRQTEPGNWDEVIDRVWAALQQRVLNHSGSGSTSSTSLEAISS